MEHYPPPNNKQIPKDVSISPVGLGATRISTKYSVRKSPSDTKGVLILLHYALG